MTIMLAEPGADDMGEAVDALREWQHDGAPFQLHPGDLGWHWRLGDAATAAAVRIWRRHRDVLAVGLLDGAALVRLAIAPHAQQDEKLARRLAEDLSLPERHVLPDGTASVEAPPGALLRYLLLADGWQHGEAWTPLRHDLREQKPTDGIRIEVIGPDRAHVRTAVHRAAFPRSTFSDERWQAMAAGLPYAEGRCLVAYDEQDDAVAAVTVWSAGPGRPGLIEPMGVHRDHRRRGYGTAITVAAAAALQEMGASSALVCTPSDNPGAVTTYESAGFEALPERLDVSRR